MSNPHRPPPEGIAIIGVAGRFPGARSVTEFWQNLRDGVESVTVFSDEELLEAGVDPSLLGNPSYVKAWGALEDADLFDASFFGYNPREAEFLDPQQRILLECAWEALEDSGYDPDTYPGSIGMWAGSGMISYYVNNIARNPRRVASVGAYQTLVGNVSDFAATRVAYKLNLKGPSFTVLSACSSSLVSVHVACASLLSSQCDMALAGGVYVRSPRKSGYLFQPGMIMSPDGHCRAFDEKAAGIIGGEGVGLVVLKRLGDALADGDTIHAVIRASAVNNDGSAKVGFTAPSVEGQAAVIRLAHERAGWDAESIGYMEAHGTATPLGDPIEIAALTQAFRVSTDKRAFCAIGSVKTNIGHLDAAAGIAGLIKAVLAVRHGVIPPSLHFHAPNPQLHIDESPFFVATRLMPWPTVTTAGMPRRAGVNSFGIGGTNAHVLVEEAPGREQPVSTRAWHLLTLSAHTPAALQKVTDNLRAHLTAAPAAGMADVCHTLQVGRRAFPVRRALVCRTAAEACDLLSSQEDAGPSLTGGTGRRPRLVFMFSGQGSQYAGMTQGIYRQERVFRDTVDSSAETLRTLLGRDIRESLFPRDGATAEEMALLNQTLLTQPALFVVEYGLARLLETWGIRPDAMIGHSIGELVAACCAGVFSLEDGLRLVARRATHMQAAPGGAMLSVFLPERSLRPRLADGLSLAVTNGPGLCVASGAADAIDTLRQSLERDGVASSRLLTSHAFHSPAMKPAASAFLQDFEGISLHAPRLPFVSNVSGRWITEAEARDPRYWARHLLETVRFSEGLSTLFTETESVLLEVGPGNALAVLAGNHPGRPAGCTALSTVRHLREHMDDVPVLLTAVGRLWECGITPDWARMHAGERRFRVSLPSYPFERERFWVAPANESRAEDTDEPPRKSPDEWMYVPTWKRVPLPGVRAAPGGGKDTWLFFIDDHWLGLRLPRALKGPGDTVITVRSGPASEWTEKDSYTMKPDDDRGCSRLISDLRRSGRLPTRVVHLWNVGQRGRAASIESLDAARGPSFASLLALCRSLGDHHAGSPVRIDVVSTGLHDINGDEVIEPEKALLLGACTVISQEYPHFACRSIDVPPARNGTTAAALLIEQLRREIRADAPESVVAYRHRSRWVPHYEQLRMDPQESAPPLKEGGICMITGGLGQVGLTLARVLAERKARLVLVGRSPFPPRHTWEAWRADHGADDPTSLRIAALTSMEELGASVLVLRADVGDEGQMRAALARVDKTFGGLDGVIHAAGVVGEKTFRPIADMGAADYDEQLHGKARGVLVLEKVLGARELDFRMMTSSLSSILGGLGFAAYAAANAFLDAFARSRVRADKAPWTSVNWDAWRSGERRESGNRFGAALERLALSPAEGAEAFRRLIAVAGLPQIILSTADIEKRRVRWSVPGDRGLAAEASPAAPPLHARPRLASVYRAPQAETEKALVRVWEELLGIDKIGIDDNFFDLGGHSLLATQVISRLRRYFHVDISLRVLFEAPTIAALAPRIEEEIIARIDRLGEQEAQESVNRSAQRVRGTRAS